MGGSLLAHAGRPMAVEVEREGDAGVSQEGLDVLGMNAFGEQQRRADMAQVVPAYIGRPARFSKGLKERLTTFWASRGVHLWRPR